MNTVVVDGMRITRDTSLSRGVYFVPSGLAIDSDGITLDGNGATLVGKDRLGRGIDVGDRRGVTIKNIILLNYYHGIYARGARDLVLQDNRITSTEEIPPDSVFIDIWRPPEEAYGGAIFLWEVRDSFVERNDLQHQMCGILTYSCKNLTIRNNRAGYNSAFGIHLHRTCDSLFEDNSVDFCCRYQPLGKRTGDMGADSAAFLVVWGSCGNVFRRNRARMGGDGFFVAGGKFDEKGNRMGCDDNLFEANDASLSPNIAFEATFCKGNKFRENFADKCNYGFWLGFSWETLIENNRIRCNRQAGIGVENGRDFVVRGNTIQENGHGILLWSRFVEEWARQFPENLTSSQWLIEKNTLSRNGKAIRIAADQDHGISPLPQEVSGKPELRPRDHKILSNTVEDNRVGVELIETDRTVLEDNALSRNVEANLRCEDCASDQIGKSVGDGWYL